MFARVIPWLVLVAAWWPSRVTGLLDGAPFDNAADAVVLGLLLPVLLWLAPAAYRTRRAQVVVVALLAWKAFTSVAFVQQGWCARVEPSRPYVLDGTGAPKAWDVRADWRSDDPRCTAIATRPYLIDEQFPVWFFNLPSATKGEGPQPEDVPPLAVTHLTLRGTMSPRDGGVLKVRTSTNVSAQLTVDGQPASIDGIQIAAGSHDVVITATLTDLGWVLAPLWNDADLFSAVPTTVTAPSVLDRGAQGLARWIAFFLAGSLVLIGLASVWIEILDWRIAVWIAATATAGALVPLWIPARRWHYTMLALLAATALPLKRPLRNVRGAFILLAPLWFSLHIVDTYLDIGFDRMQLLMPGNDWWQFQRYAYRIYMQGYWLEGGEITFWFRPLYRWIAGALHMLFGQGQTGENYWDAIGVMIIALFAFDAVRRLRGFKWGLVAGALALTTYLSGPGHVFIGRGLSEITSAAFIYLAALCALEARAARSLPLAIGSGACAVLAAWTRENNLPMAVAVVMFAWPLDVPASVLWTPREWFAKVWRPIVIAIPTALTVGTVLFALRTWYYTGAFTLPWVNSQINHLAVWQPGMTMAAALQAMLSSVMMVATTTDPPRFHNGAIPILAGAALSLVALVGAPLARRLPLALVAFTMSGFVSALIARGTAYSGRFSIHIVGATVAVLVCAASAIIDNRQVPVVDEQRTAA